MSKRRFRARRYVLAVVALALAIAAAWYVLRHVNLGLALRALHSASPAWILAAALINTLTVLVQGERLHSLVSSVRLVPRRMTTEAVALGFASSQLLPARGGEVVKLTLVSRNASLSSSTVVGIVTLETIFNAMGLLLIAAAVFAIGGGPWWINRILIAGAIALPIALFLIYRLRPAEVSPEAHRVLAKLQHIRNNLHAGFAPMRRPKSFAVALGLTVGAWALELGTAWATLIAFHFETGLIVPLILLLGVNVAILLPITPGQLGVYELAATLILRQAGLDTSTAIMVALVYHLVHMVPTLLLATFFLLWRQLRPATTV